MANPLGPNFADFYMTSTENTLLSQDRAPNPKYYKPYMNKILAVFSKRSHVNLFKTRMKRLTILNSTHEEFNDNNIHFLDISFKIAIDESCHASVYIKSTDAASIKT